MQWFGDPWSVDLMPPGDPAAWVATPVGQICPLCREPISRTDRGHVSEMVDGTTLPRHLECEFVFLVAGEAQLNEGWCLRCGVSTGVSTSISRRFQARLAWNHYSDRHRRPGERQARHRA